MATEKAFSLREADRGNWVAMQREQPFEAISAPAREPETGASAAIDESRAAGAANGRDGTGTPIAIGLGIWLLALVSTWAWHRLFGWYGLFENEHNTHFAFEKVPGWFDSPIIRRTLLLFLLIGIIYGAAIWLYGRLPAPAWPARLGLLALAAGPAIFNVILYPVGALDVFNYMIELKLTYHYDQNPYVVTFNDYRADPFALPAFLVDITLFYGPAWLLVSWIPTVIAGFDRVLETLLALKIFNLMLLAVTALLIARYQRDARLRWVAALLFLANPLVLFEGVANAHNDVLMTAFLVGGMLALQRRSPLAGPLLALSALIKLNALILAPLFLVVMLKERWGWKRVAQSALLTLLAVTLVSAPWWGEGKLIDGLRNGLEQSQEMDHVSLLSLARQYAQHQEANDAPHPREAEFIRSRPSMEVVPAETLDRIQFGFGALLVIGTLLLAASVWRGRPPELAASSTLLLLLLLGTNLYAWYLIPVFALLALRVDRIGFTYIVVATAAGLAYYPMYVYGHFTSDMSRFEVHQFLALFLTLPILIYLVARGVDTLVNLRRARSAPLAAHPAAGERST